MSPQDILEAIATLTEAERRDLFARLLEVYGESPAVPQPKTVAKSDWEGQVDYLIVFDGGSKGNPGAGYGSYAVFDASGSGHTMRLAFEDAPMTNNEAEYHTLLAALRDLRTRLGKRASSRYIKILGDSQLVIRQVSGEWEAKDARMRALRDGVRAELAHFKGYRLGHQPREETLKVLGH
jgi:ribonuclease HI